VKKVYASTSIDMEVKEKMMAILAAADSSDMLGRTKAFCEAAIPTIESKRAVWTKLFSKDKKDDMTLYNYIEMTMAFRPFG
jgi:hypothetical protein